MKKLYILTALLIALTVNANAQPKFGVPTAFKNTINDLLCKIPINIAGNSIRLTLEGDTWRGQLNGQDLLAGVFQIDEGPDGAIITIKQSFMYADTDTGKKVPLAGKPIAAWVDTPEPELFFEYKKSPPMSILPTSQETAAAAPAVPPTASNKVDVISPDSGWYTNKDGKSDADIIYNMEQIDGKEQYVMTIEVNNAANGWAGAYTGNEKIIQNLRNAGGVRFKALGDGMQWGVIIKLGNISDNIIYRTIITTQKGKVTSHDISFNRLKQPDWAKKSKFNNKNISNINFERNNETGTGPAVVKIFDFEIIPEGGAAAIAATNIPQGPGEHDLIVMLNGTMIDAEIQEISPKQIKYTRPETSGVYAVNKSDVSFIKHKSGVLEVINEPGQNSARTDPNRLYTGFSFEPSGFISGGPSLTLEFTKGALMSSLHASFPSLALNSTASGFGFGAGGALSYYWSGPIGGFFAGGVLEWNMYPYSVYVYNPYAKYNPDSNSFSPENVKQNVASHSFILALQGGYKFVLKNGFYFRTGVAAGMSFSTFFPSAFYYKPDIATGYIF